MLRLNELYTSVQGEGPNVGKPTIFVRFSGCNMRCPGWPCDTQHAIQPSLWRNDPRLTPAQVAERVYEHSPHHVCLTGGEPFMQSAADLEELYKVLLPYTMDIFSNGSFTYPEWTIDPKVTIVLDWKLSGSGESQRAHDERLWNVHHRLGYKDALKFTVKDEEDLIEAEMLYDAFQPVEAQVFVGRVWGTELTDDDIVQFVLERKLPWRLNIQTHKLIWPNKERGI